MIDSSQQAEQGSSLWFDAWIKLRKNKLALVGFVILLFLIVVSLLTPWIAPYSYEEQNLMLGATAPSAAHWLGTDIFGRDMLTRIMYGGECHSGNHWLVRWTKSDFRSFKCRNF